ncbi:hypothetical protein SCHPADRAFT_593635 [Schizopora paradoxa]|uniref:NACHT domain-containing protein n=1 Tax=Schizopora paradoxa TaxID=27342 RepID=A0A0H2RVH5_9AGAM|nr:hypothetical protein SCHPADRAFT_593635 [Schizopora paradoxa]
MHASLPSSLMVKLALSYTLVQKHSRCTIIIGWRVIECHDDTISNSLLQRQLRVLAMSKFSVRKLFRWSFRRLHQRDVDNNDTRTKPGNQATGGAEFQAAINVKEGLNQGQKNSIVGEESSRQGESQDAAKIFLNAPVAPTTGRSEAQSRGEEEPPADINAQGGSARQDKFLETLRIFFRIGETVAGAFPFPGSDIVFSALTGIVDRVETTEQNKETKENIRKRISSLQTLARRDGVTPWTETRHWILKSFESDIVEKLLSCAVFTESRTKLSGFIYADLDERRLSDLDDSIFKAVQDLQTKLILETLNSMSRMEQKNLDEANAKVLEKLKDQLPKTATYDSDRPRLIACHEGTCNAILKEVKAWAKADEDRPQMMWLSGLAGTGKSSVAKTVAAWADELGLLGTSFFFSRDFEALYNPSYVFPSIALHLSESKLDPSLAQCIEKTLVDDRGNILNKEIAVQFKKLIEEPLRSTRVRGITRRRLLLVIDGLDECKSRPNSDSNDVATIISLLSRLLPTNPHIRILLVSRPEVHIQDALSTGDQLYPHVVRHKVEDFVNPDDIREYLCQEFKKINEIGWPSEDDFNVLAQSCGKLFVYASTAMNFIRGDSSIRSRKESLQILLSVNPGGGYYDAYKRLDELYIQILSTAVKYTKEVDSKEMIRFRQVIGTLALIRNPLSISSLAVLVGVEEEEIWSILKFLRSVIIVPSQASEDREVPPQFYHPSLPEFLTDAKRCDDERFFVSETVLEGFLFKKCQEVVVYKGLSGQVDEKLFPILEYACVYWGNHLEGAGHEDAMVVKALDKFLQCHILKWYKFAFVFLRTAYKNADDEIFLCMEVARNWVSKRKTSDKFKELSMNLDSVIQSSWTISCYLDIAGMYDAARSRCGGKATRRTPCHPGTRQKILEEIQDWARNLSSTVPNVYWLRGTDLTGKSAIAMSLAGWADKNGIPCVAYLPRYTVNFTALCEMIAFEIASFDRSTRNLVSESLILEREAGGDDEIMFKHLVAEPLLKQRDCPDPLFPILIVIDGLEKIRQTEELRALTLFFNLLSGPDNSHIRIVMTSNSRSDNDARICEVFESQPHRFMDLDKTPDEDTRKDIKLYLYEELTRIGESQKWEPAPSDLEALVDDCRGSFRCAKYALNFIGDSKPQKPVQLLQSWLNRDFPENSIDKVFSPWYEDHQESREILQSVAVQVIWVVTARLPDDSLSVAFLAEFLQVDMTALEITLRYLYPLVFTDMDGHLRPIHPSLPSMGQVSSSSPFYLGSYPAGRRCLDIINESLIHLIAFGDGDEGVSVQKRVNSRSNSMLRFASRYWAVLLNQTCRDDYDFLETVKSFEKFLENNWLSWLYAMSLLELASEVASAMSYANEWCGYRYTGSFDAKDFTKQESFIKSLLREARKFFEKNQQEIAESPLQVYRAVLDLPEDSELRRVYKTEAEERLRAL